MKKKSMKACCDKPMKAAKDMANKAVDKVKSVTKNVKSTVKKAVGY